MIHSKLLKVVNQSDSRYLTADEQSEILAYAESLPRRLEVSNRIANIEQQAIDQALNRLKQEYPRFESYHENGWQKGVRDMQLFLRYVVQGMVLDDMDVPQDKVLVWFSTILSSFSMTPKFVREGFQYLLDAMRNLLDAESFAMIEPHVVKGIDVVCHYPEPATPAV